MKNASITKDELTAVVPTKNLELKTTRSRYDTKLQV